MMLQIDTDSPTKQKNILYADGDAEHYLNVPHLSLCHVQRGNILISSESISNLEGVFINSWAVSPCIDPVYVIIFL